ncbi:oxygen-insensitive NADPH nitroreductase [Alkalihalobacillus sp. BA299]|uniref:oxygen-insensitive NADPH nitroreductase n=1 Tax=Alkalihalobacillus sp. BA299 TaxID=2815938 RepID=UPI0027DDAFC3|nr:oxygen-insensitive NADPH nitroreductase [Alkalihalobacillus sp. BA299]
MSNKKKNLDIIKHLQDHRSIRQFTNEKIPKEDIEQIILSAQAAPSSSHGQAYSVICVTEEEKKSKLAEYAGGQQQVENCSHFFVFCADLHRLEKIARRSNINMKEPLDSTEMFLIATVDATIVAQNTAVAAEALGLGIVYIGGLRNNPDKVSDLLKLPYRCYPVFGMCIGYPDSKNIPEKKPRLPHKAVFYKNEYLNFEKTLTYIEEYDEIMKTYYEKRTNGKRSDTWSETMIDKRKIPRRLHLKSFLKDRGFPLI